MKISRLNTVFKKIQLLKFVQVQGHWRRQGFVKFVFVSLFALFSYHATSISTHDNQEYSIQDRAQKQANKKQLIEARRGDVLDRHGNILASSRLLKKIILDPSLIHTAFIPKLAEALAMDEKKLSDLLAKKRKIKSQYLPIKNNITLTDPILDRLKSLRKLRIEVCRDKEIREKISLSDKILNKIHWQSVTGEKKIITRCKKERIKRFAFDIQQDSQRYYPKSASLAPLLGRVNSTNKGRSGIEGEFENVLAGKNGKSHLNYINNHNKAYFNPQIEHELRHGGDIELTIDTDIQYHAYAAIKKSVLKHEADSGSAIILAPNGEILAMANYPADDPNDKSVYNPSHYRNRILSDKVEPGSTMKPFTMLLALEQGKITATDDELIDVSKSTGHIKSNKEVRKYGDAITIKKILQKSHNLGTVNVSERLSKEDMYHTWSQLGFGHPLGLIPSIENSGLLRHSYEWSLSDKRALSYGYGPMNTNLAQLARAYLVFANEGSIPSLKLVKNISAYESTEKVFSKKSTDKIAELLDSVASDDGSGYRAIIKGYDIAGKTGTAEMLVDGKYNKKGAKRTFFTGFVPVKNPKYIMAVRLDYPKKCPASWDSSVNIKCQGSNTAAMVFHDAMRGILTNDSSIKLHSK